MVEKKDWLGRDEKGSKMGADEHRPLTGRKVKSG